MSTLLWNLLFIFFKKGFQIYRIVFEMVLLYTDNLIFTFAQQWRLLLETFSLLSVTH